VKSKWDYLCALKSAIEDSHGCSARYLRTRSVEEVVRGKTVWIGDVEIFALTGHPKARRCYAWNHHEGKRGRGGRFVAMLKIPPVNSPETAVRASLVLNSKKGR